MPSTTVECQDRSGQGLPLQAAIFAPSVKLLHTNDWGTRQAEKMCTLLFRSYKFRSLLLSPD